jgi:farnesyl-diphosphate farnesyltransferase
MRKSDPMEVRAKKCQQAISFDQRGVSAVSPDLASSAEDALQVHLLNGVSRTFALTIPELPPHLTRVVSNAYLLCRIVDTIEDEPALQPRQKRELTDEFARVVAGASPPGPFAVKLLPLLSHVTLPAEHVLVKHTPDVIGITHACTRRQRDALERCVCIMATGMAEFQEIQSPRGLRDLEQLNRYCYIVAGVVGEMLTELFCDYSLAIGRNRDRLMALAISFGQGLQMTNILKDIWEDRRRGACWLPQEVFTDVGFDLRDLNPDHFSDNFGRGLSRLIALAHGHLHQALDYTLLIPRQETGIRNFCCWAIGMAELTLRKINRRKHFSAGNQVKISRLSVSATVLASRTAASHDPLLRLLFRLAGLGLPRPPAAPNPK